MCSVRRNHRSCTGMMSRRRESPSCGERWDLVPRGQVGRLGGGDVHRRPAVQVRLVVQGLARGSGSGELVLVRVLRRQPGGRGGGRRMNRRRCRHVPQGLWGQVSRTVPAVALVQSRTRPRLGQQMLVPGHRHGLASVVVGRGGLDVLLGVVPVGDDRHGDRRRRRRGLPLVPAVVLHRVRGGRSQEVPPRVGGRRRPRHALVATGIHNVLIRNRGG